MAIRNLLLLSSSSVGEGEYLEYAQPLISEALNACTGEILFIPFAGVTLSYDEYEAKVRQALRNIGIEMRSIHHSHNPAQAIQQATAIMVGGGNSFHLLYQLYQFDLLGLMREKIMSGAPYIGWSAGANIASPTIKTTNDMPIIQPPSLHALRLVPFQINPHYHSQLIPGFNGETRDERLREFMLINPHLPVVALPEGAALRIYDQQLVLLGQENAWLFAENEKKIFDTNQAQALLRSGSD